MSLFSRAPVVPVVRLSGAIGVASGPFQQGLSLASCAGPLAKAFKAAKNNAVAIVINSPGGAPVQSRLIFQRIRDLAAEKKRRVYVFCEDVAASGGYMIALAGDEIYADPTSIVGSIGVISASFGFVEAMEKVGVERRVYTAGKSKSLLDPFRPEDPDGIARLKGIQEDIHTTFKDMVRERRGNRLRGEDSDLFEGQVWSGRQAIDVGLIDGLADVRGKMRDVFGDKVKLKLVSRQRSLFMRAPGGVMAAATSNGFADRIGTSAAEHAPRAALATLEERALWAKFGL